MLIICEDCAKRYNIDESRIRGNRARFSCKECGHIIIVEKTDLTRPLISKSSSSSDMSGTIDLLREMEESSPSGLLGEGASEAEIRKLEKDVLATKKCAPIAAYFALAFAAAFLCISGALAYLYMVDISPLIRQSEVQNGFLVKSLTMLGGAWIIVLIVFYLLARILTKPIIILKENIVRQVRGEEVAEEKTCGPREIKELASILSRVTGNRQ